MAINSRDIRRCFGFTHQKPLKGDKTRFNVRCILRNNNGEICAVKSEKYGYVQIPGGGIKDKDKIIDALRREIQEETGYLITGIKPIGYILDKRDLEIAKCIKKNNMSMGK